MGVVASLPFASDIVTPAIRHFVDEVHRDEPRPCGFRASFNTSYPLAVTSDVGWVSPWHFGLNHGPIVLMIENYRTGLVWHLMRRCPYLVTGLRRAGFRGGWL